ncbi:ABC transporter permease [Rhizobium rosettiformans]|uniref:ABC transporter permease n=1 Tax=Rhizobium rosettiformans W3 TaxID=538378 RepID=A0A4S8PTB0_9HYPH|nr:ABC transporter permease [Rhizobium rosettiformans]THV33035.1 ABC transporter permease [Rhizobium rosettiformans W3]
MRVSNIIELGIKELRGLARDPALLFLIVYAFTLNIYTAATAEPETLNKAAVAIVDEDRSQVSTRIENALYPPYFLPPQMIAPNEIDPRMNAGVDTFVLDIPPGFQRDLLADKAPQIQLNVDATQMTQAFSGGRYIQEIVTQEVNAFLDRGNGDEAATVGLSLRARFNPELDKGWFGSINEVISAVTMLSIILTGAALIREREHGTIEHLLVMPVTPADIMLSKIWSMGLVVLLATMFSLFVVVEAALDVPLRGSLLLFLVGAALQLVAATCMGIFLATVAGSMPQFGLLLMLVLLPLQILSGGMTPRESMPEVIQWIMSAAPNTHFVIMAQAVLFRDAGLAVVWPQILALIAISAIFFVLSLQRFRAFLR